MTSPSHIHTQDRVQPRNTNNHTYIKCLPGQNKTMIGIKYDKYVEEDFVEKSRSMVGDGGGMSENNSIYKCRVNQ